MPGGLFQLIAYGMQDSYDVNYDEFPPNKKVYKYTLDLNMYGCDICLDETIHAVKTYCGCSTKYCDICAPKMNNKCCVCKRFLTGQTSKTKKEVHKKTTVYQKKNITKLKT